MRRLYTVVNVLVKVTAYYGWQVCHGIDFAHRIFPHETQRFAFHDQLVAGDATWQLTQS
jgi:hypothetical protein